MKRNIIVKEPVDTYDLKQLADTLAGLNALYNKTGVALDGTMRTYGAGTNGDGHVTFDFYLDGAADKYQIEVRQ